MESPKRTLNEMKMALAKAAGEEYRREIAELAKVDPREAAFNARKLIDTEGVDQAIDVLAVVNSMLMNDLDQTDRAALQRFVSMADTDLRKHRDNIDQASRQLFAVMKEASE